MNATRPTLPGPRLRLLTLGFLAVAALSACVATGDEPSVADGPDPCARASDCEEPGRLATQVRLDTEAILAGMAHARARLGLQEDAAP